MEKIKNFINRYPLSKTLRFSLIPVGKTEENFEKNCMLETDEKRAKAYSRVKGYIDRYHRYFIESVLSRMDMDIKDYAEIYYKPGKTDSDLKNMEKAEADMRKKIATAFAKDDTYNLIFGKGIIETVLPQYLTVKEELDDVAMFNKFATYFNGFHTNRKNMYSSEAQSTAISYRCINDNLPKFLDNALNFNKIKIALGNKIEELNEICMSLYGIYPQDIFSLDYFGEVLSQSGIDTYNSIIGGYTDGDKNKIQGINELINLYNQQKEKNQKLPFMKQLYKQILSERETVSFIPESFETDDELIEAVGEYYRGSLKKLLGEIKTVFEKLPDFDCNGIYLSSGLAVTNLSNAVFGRWSAVSEAWNNEYEALHPLKKVKDAEKYYEKQKSEYKKIKSFSLQEIQRLGESCVTDECIGNVIEYYMKAIPEKVACIESAYDGAKELLNENYTENNDKRLCKNDAAIQLLKTLLDAIKELELLLKPLKGTGKEENKEDLFYGEFLPLYDSLSEIDRVYDKVRNYVTKKPYSKDKIKLNFDNPQLLGGWDRNKESDYRSVLLRKNGLYYLVIMDKSNSKVFEDVPNSEELSGYEKMEYKLLPGPNKMLPKVFFAKSNESLFTPDENILKIRDEETFKKGDKFNMEDCRELIDFFKRSISKHEDWSRFGFEFSPTDSYSDISGFYNEVKNQGYKISFKNISDEYINELVEDGKIYLFKIHNKDFSEYSHGTPNMHTLYFKMLFDERNLADVVYKLNGEAEMFYRKASIRENERIIHYANEPIENKNIVNSKKNSTFDYDIIKDKRFTKRQFSLHLPITMNFKADG